jgi:hypothetical protein
MDYLQEIQAYADQPQQLEKLYQSAQKSGEITDFVQAVRTCYTEMPENMLYSAWYFRLKAVEVAKPQVPAPVIPAVITPAASQGISLWLLALPLAILNGLVFWALSDPELMFLDYTPYLALFGAPIAALFLMGFIALASPGSLKPALIAGAGLVLACIYVLLVVPTQPTWYHSPTTTLMMIHLALLAWVAAGLTVLSFRSTSHERFPFLIKSLEVFITGGLYLMAGGAFGAITVGMFQALNIVLSDVLMRLIAAGGVGLLPVIALASIYDPRLKPSEQDFRQGLSKFIANMMRLLLPLTLVILVIYVLVIPFKFMEPFQNRDVLIVYNAMLFAIIGLLVGVTPVRAEDLSPRLQSAIRTGILAVAILAILVSLYALSAVIYRTVLGGITINRLTVIGWNTLNTGILVWLAFRLLRNKHGHWAEELKSVFSLGMVGYTVWGLFIVIAIPLLFR